MQRLDALITQLVSVQGPQAHWQPTHCGTLPIKIDTEANWFHDGTRVTRQELIKLWASVLRVEYENGESFIDASYHLTTPAEDVEIEVDDVPFIIQSWTVVSVEEGEVIVVTDNLQRQWPLCTHFPLINRVFREQQIPYMVLNGGLLARISRHVYYQWAERAIENEGLFWLVSGNDRFLLAD
ncbi:DUF1285 domain-containing protein [Pseudoalteromonas xiamenensis]